MQKSALRKFFIFGFFVLCLVIFSGLGCQVKCNPAQNTPITLTYWRLFDDSDVFAPMIAEYKKLHPNITIEYKKIATYEEYQSDLIDAFAKDQGPDMFSIHHTLVLNPNWTDFISPMPQTLMSLREFQDTFVDVAQKDLIANTTKGDQIMALPLSMDTLALYYNKDIFNTYGIANPPTTWEEFQADVQKLTKIDSEGNIVQAGAAIGTAANINRAPDILGVLMLQNGTPLPTKTDTTPKFNTDQGQNAMQFYTDFANPSKSSYTWNSRMHFSIDAFSEGNTAMMINYLYNIPVVQAKAPKLNFAVAKLPQPKDASQRIDFANYWAETVSAKSKHPQEAWEFLKFLTSKEASLVPATTTSSGCSSSSASAQQTATTAYPVREYLEKTGNVPARRDLIDEWKGKPVIGVFAEQALTASSWYRQDYGAIDTIFNDAIDSVVLGKRTVPEAVGYMVSQIQVLH